MSNTKIKKIVFSGGPNVGKTSILLELKKRGYQVRNEVFTKLFSEMQKENRLDDLFKNKEALINRLIALQIEEENFHNINAQEYIFFDRGIIDISGFAKEIEYNLTQQKISIIENINYDFCFIPEPLDKQFYEQNSVRRQTFEESLERHKQCINIYIEYFKSKDLEPEKHIIYVPNISSNYTNLSIDQRVDFVLKTIRDRNF